MEILITENAYNIKKVNFEIYDTMLGTKLEEGTVISLIRFVGIFLSFQIFLNIYTFFLIKQ